MSENRLKTVKTEHANRLGVLEERLKALETQRSNAEEARVAQPNFDH